MRAAPSPRETNWNSHSSMTPRLGSRRGASSVALPPVLTALGSPALDVRVLPEPLLVFGDFQRTVDPRIGLGLYGPFDLTDKGRRSAIRLGVIGDGHTIELFQQWLERCNGRVAPIRRVRYKGQVKSVPMDPTVYPFFPGLERAFDVDVFIDDGLIQTFGSKELAELLRIEYFEPRVTRLVDMVIERLGVLDEKPNRPDVVMVALNSDLRAACTQPTRHKRRADVPLSPQAAALRNLKRDVRAGQENLFDATETFNVSAADLEQATAQADEHGVFHHGLKARAMKIGLPTQLVWESSLAGIGVQDDATRAWNFWTAVYYKAGNVPWRSAAATRDTCFVGVSFYVDKQDGSYRSAMAQAFSDHGQGMVLRGQRFRWTELQSPHLTRELAEDLMRRLLTEYERHLRHRPSRVVVHKWSRYWDKERAGFDEGLREIPSVDYVALGSRGIRFYRAGHEPPLRGTMVTLARDNALLYTRGYVPFFGAHTGPRTPRPIEIVEHIGPTALTQICQELLILTKLDWNTADFGGKEPITTAFSEDVGHILAELPRDAEEPRTQYRFYM